MSASNDTLGMPFVTRLTHAFLSCYFIGAFSSQRPMFSLGTLLRCLLIVAFCLEGTLSLWTSSAMAAEGAVAAAASGAAESRDGLAADPDCEDDASHEQGRTPHRDCDCGSGSGCCACAFPVLAVVHSVPFAAQHRLADQPPTPAPASVVPAAATGVFRPPIA